MAKERLDKVLVERGLAETRQRAQAMIMAGLVFSGTERLEKPGRLIPSDLEIAIKDRLPYVGRGGLKLAEALDAFGLDIRGRICADIGSSTGGFTDCLLQRGAELVYAVDVDTRQIDPVLRRDPRVALVEKNARDLAAADFPRMPRIVTLDVSFISVLKILPALKRIADTNPVSETDIPSPDRGPFVALALIKPQFEAERGRVGKKGVIRDPEIHRQTLEKVAAGAAVLGFRLRRLLKCSTPGQKGNREFFALWSLEGLPPERNIVLKWIEEVIRDEKN